MPAPKTFPPFVHKVICGWKLRELRQHASLTQKSVATLTKWSQSRIASIESGTTYIAPHNLDKLLEIYEADEPSRKLCHEQSLLGEGKMPRDTLRTRFTGDMQKVIDMEASAATRWEHTSMLIPGLLQTEDYMRTLFRAYRPSLTKKTIDQHVANRLDRQAVLNTAKRKFWFVIDEAALRRLENIDGSSAILRNQVEHISSALDRSNVEVQIVPFSHGYYIGQAENYLIFGYKTRPPVQLVYAETYDGGDILHDTKSVTKFLSLWEHQKAAGLGPEQSRTFLRDMARSS